MRRKTQINEEEGIVMSVVDYLKGLFENVFCVSLGLCWGAISSFLFPEEAYKTAAMAVLIMMTLDLVTKLYALRHQAGNLKKAITTRVICSNKFAKGTMDKLLIFGILLIVCGCAYLISPFSSVATSFTQMVFLLMFLRDVLSVIENLTDAGVGGLSLFKKLAQNKLDEVVKGDDADEEVAQYPDRILGTVSVVPHYSQWGTGKIQVNNRIWIKVK